MNRNVYQNARLGEVLKEYGYITEEQLKQALEAQKARKGARIGGVLMEMGFITEPQMLKALAQHLKMEVVDISGLHVEMDAVEKIPEKMARRYKMLGVSIEDDILLVLTNDPLNFYGMEDVRQVTGMNLKVFLCESQMLDHSIQYYYAEVATRRAVNKANKSRQEKLEPIQAEDGDEEAPVVNLLSRLIHRAFHNNASDIHIEPFEDRTEVRMRIDGVIMGFATLQKSLHESLIARIKIVGDMDIAERRIPQDGHFRMRVEEQTVNIRISLLPTVFGEKAVIRLLNSNSQIDYAGTYGMEPRDYDKVSKMLHLPNGLIYMTGPTGSGKTTTLYMILNDLAKRNVNISTIEDPVEWNLPKINQTQVNNTAGMTFEVGLRALLRQDPDIIMVGETRDNVTASISVRAAITGHLVLSTLHTNDAVSAIVRLQDMGVQPYLISNSLVGIVAQRLMRKLCPDCAREIGVDEEASRYLGRSVTKIKVPDGCPNCNNTGYRGRIAIHEVLWVDKKIREMITDGIILDKIRAYSIKEQGLVPLYDSAAKLVAEGVTSLEELFKVAYYE